MDSFHTQREYGAAVEAHYGLKNVTKVSMPTNEHDEPLVVHISMLVGEEDIKGIAARFAGEVPAKTVGTPKVDALMAKWEDDGARRGAAFLELRDLARQLESASAKTSIGELTVKLDTSLIAEALEPGGMYLPASAVRTWRGRCFVTVGEMIELGAIVAK